MEGERRDAAGLHDTAASDGPHGNVGTAAAATADNVPDHTAHDIASATAAMGDECQWYDSALSKWQWQHEW